MSRSATWAALVLVSGCIGTIEPQGGFRDADPPPPADAEPPDVYHPPVDCKAPLPLTLPWRVMPNFVGTEDIAFDDVGNVIESDTNNIYKTTYEGVRTIFVPNFQFRAGMRLTPGGDLIVNDNNTGSLVRVSPEGVRTTLLSGLSYPNGMEVDQEGYVYVSEQTASRVIRVNPLIPGDSSVLTLGVPQPNGLSFDPSYSHLYIGSFGASSSIWKLVVNEDGTPGALTEWALGVGTGANDGLAVDACGNVYVCDYGASNVIRIDPTGTTKQVVADHGFYLPNMDWGKGIGGWDPLKLYFVAVGAGLVEMDVGLPSKPRW